MKDKLERILEKANQPLLELRYVDKDNVTQGDGGLVNKVTGQKVVKVKKADGSVGYHNVATSKGNTPDKSKVKSTSHDRTQDTAQAHKDRVKHKKDIHTATNILKATSAEGEIDQYGNIYLRGKDSGKNFIKALQSNPKLVDKIKSYIEDNNRDIRLTSVDRSGNKHTVAITKTIQSNNPRVNRKPDFAFVNSNGKPTFFNSIEDALQKLVSVKATTKSSGPSITPLQPHFKKFGL
jgi:hypothetical protein